MSASSAQSLPSKIPGKALGAGGARAGDSDLSAFNLRDTLGGIIVRETNFNEFLVALKRFGMTAAKQ